MAKDIQKKEEAGLPANYEAFLNDHAGQGTGNIDPSKGAKPFLQIGQCTSGVVTDGVVKFGNFYATITGEDLGNRIQVIVLDYEIKWVEWMPDGGDFVASYTNRPAEAITDDDFRYRMPSGNDLRETHYFWVIIPGRQDLGVMAFTAKSVSFKYGTKWANKMLLLVHPKTGKKAPSCSAIWEIWTSPHKNKAGKPSFQLGEGKTPNASMAGWVESDLFYKEVKPALDFLEHLDRTNFADKEDSGEVVDETWQ